MSAIITGSNGIGRSCAIGLGKLGYKNFLLGFKKNEQNANQLKQHLESQYQAKVTLIQGDITTENGVQETVDKYFKELKDTYDNQLTTIIHSAGAILPVDENAYDGYHFMYSKFFYEILEKGLPLMKDGEGKVVAISSPGCNLAYRPRPKYYAGPAKASLEILVRNYALKEAPRRININCIVPGYINTTAWPWPRNVVEDMAKKNTPMGQFYEPDVIGNAVAWLCSKDAAPITGVLLPVDGGLHLA